MLKLEATYSVVIDGVHERELEREVIASDEAKASIDATVKAWLDGKLEPVRDYGGGHANVEARETLLLVTSIDKATGQRRHATRPVPIKLEHIMSAKLRRRGSEGHEHTEEGAAVAPVVRVVLDSGNKFDLPVVKGKAPKAEKD